MMKLLLFGFFLSATAIVQVSGKRKHKLPARYHPDFRYCMDSYLFPKFFKTFCPGKGERWLNSRASKPKHVLNPLLNQDTAKSFVKSVGSGSGSGSIVREDFYNAYREECCDKGCRLEEALEFCNTLN